MMFWTVEEALLCRYSSGARKSARESCIGSVYGVFAFERGNAKKRGRRPGGLGIEWNIRRSVGLSNYRNWVRELRGERDGCERREWGNLDWRLAMC